MGKNKVAIVIQFHNPEPSYYEYISFRRCFEILGEYPIIFVVSKRLDVSKYIALAEEYAIVPEVIRFSPKYFKSIRGYNMLLTSYQFYSAFSDYEFILLHHPDVYVFRNDLEFWIEQDYDLIGPPMYEFNGTLSPENYIGVGTSGFSLKKVKSHLEVLKSYRIIYSWKAIFKWYKQYNLKGKIFYLPYFLRLLVGIGNNSHHLLNNLRINDDIVWGVLVNKAFKEFKVADEKTASKFGLEYNCERLLELNNNQLPFGCHQWFKGEFYEFWKDKLNDNITQI